MQVCDFLWSYTDTAPQVLVDIFPVTKNNLLTYKYLDETFLKVKIKILT